MVQRLIDNGTLRIARSTDTNIPEAAKRANRTHRNYGYYDPETGVSWLFSDNLTDKPFGDGELENAYAAFLP